MIVNLAVMGASGVGKTNLGDLFHDDVEVIEPYRVRPKGARAGEHYFVAPAMFEELLALNRIAEPTPLFFLDSDDGETEPYAIGRKNYRKWLEIHSRASFFTIRKDLQVLLQSKRLGSNLRKVEIFSPVLSLMLSAVQKNPHVQQALRFLHEADLTIFVLLNPLDRLVLNGPKGIIDGCGWARKQWTELQRKRIEEKGKSAGKSSEDIRKELEKAAEEISERVDILPLEAETWQTLDMLAARYPKRFILVHCERWTHFEWKYSANKDAKAKAENEAARADLLKAAKKAGVDRRILQFLR